MVPLGSKPRKQNATHLILEARPETRSVLGCKSINKQSFISFWKCVRGRSFASNPNGFSSSIEMKFKANMPRSQRLMKLKGEMLMCDRFDVYKT